MQYNSIILYELKYLSFCGTKGFLCITTIKIHILIHLWFLKFTPISFAYKLKQTLSSSQVLAGTNQQFWKTPLCTLNLVSKFIEIIGSGISVEQVTHIERTQVYLFQRNELY